MVQAHSGVAGRLPDWLPEPIRLYLDHIEGGLSLRALARLQGCHASTILRRVRRCESRRDDPLLDEALSTLAAALPPAAPFPAPLPDRHAARKDRTPMSHPQSPRAFALDEATIQHEARRILRRLAEPGAVLVIAPDMEKAVVLREVADGQTVRMGVLDRSVAQAFALKEWIACRKPGRVSSYRITAVGRAALRRLPEADAEGAGGLAEAPSPFASQHRDWGSRTVDTGEGPRRVRASLSESPIAIMGRRRDKDGKPFLDRDLVEAGERLREDFELAQMGPRVAQNWDRFLTGGDRGGFRADSGLAEGPRVARDRVAAALRDLGPGLGDVALRVCCFLEGIEAAERRMGWAARSGKVVLRIALQRLRRHYDEVYGKSGPLIG